MKGKNTVIVLNTEKSEVSTKFFRFLSQHRALAILIIIGVYIAIFGSIYPQTFLTFGNFSKVLMSMSIETFIVIAMAILLISGEIDLSLGPNMILAGIVCGALIKYEIASIPVAILITFVVSILLGLINGFIVARIGVNSLIATLASGMIFQGIAVWMAGPGLSSFPKSFQMIGQKVFLSLQLPIWYVIMFIAVFAFLMSHMRFFRQYYYIGGNVKTAVLSGISVNKMKIILFIIASLLASVAGILSVARINSAGTAVGFGVELRAVTAAIIGGVSFAGGAGSILGAAAGALFISFLNNGLIIAGVDSDMQNVVTGVVLILAIVVDLLIARKKS